MNPVIPNTPSPDAPVNPNIPALGGQMTQLPTQVTVQPVPAGHPYAQHILPVDLEPSYTVLVDPKVPDAPEGQWWPRSKPPPT